MDSAKPKRERTVNFTDIEIRILIDAVIRHINIIENKKTDAVTWKEKAQTWEIVAAEVNELTALNRTAKILRSKYECIKKNIKHKNAKNRLEMYKTGGGKAEIEMFTDYEYKLLSYICISVEGLPSENDSDSIALPSVASCSAYLEQKHQHQVQEADNLAEYSQNNSFEIVYDEDDSCSIFTNTNTSEAVGSNEKSSLKTWKTWKPNALKEHKHQTLSGTTPTVKKQITKDYLNKKIDTLTDSRKDLLNVQLEIAKQEKQEKLEFFNTQKQIKQTQEQQHLEEHKLIIANLTLQQEILTNLKERQKREGELNEQLLLLEIENKKLEILIKKKHL